jgi:uncharacterized protein with HEPN domain
VSRDAWLYVADMIEACERVLRFTKDVARADLAAGTMVHDAVLLNLEVLGEAAKRVPPEARVLAPAIAWRRIAGLRDVLAHAYFGIYGRPGMPATIAAGVLVKAGRRPGRMDS